MEPKEVKRREFLIASALTGAAAMTLGSTAQGAPAKGNMIDKKALEDVAGTFADTSPKNRISEKDAWDASYVGMRIFERPILSIGSADDRWFERMKEKGVIGDHFYLPNDWLPGAKSVISVFSPFTERVRKSNTLSPNYPSREWLHGRIEGQHYIEGLNAQIRDYIVINGARALSPMLDTRFAFGPAEKDGDRPAIPAFNSNWSERHVAFICGLGTFGRHTCLITKSGTAGRLCSIITDLPLPVDGKDYEGRFDYCIQCGTCQRRCPGQAIAETGKDIGKCAVQLASMMKYAAPRYGCGKCQTAVPCETKAPGRKA
jgi:epoxyqueuosine reductase QueG